MKASEKFPRSLIPNIEGYTDKYFSEYSFVANAIERDKIAQAVVLVQQTVGGGGTIYSCANGGSAAISNHLLCDFAKGIQTGTAIRPKVVSLSAHLELLLVIGNDISFEEVFSFQIRSWGRSGDLLMAISSSGNSENIVGFTGGRAVEFADVAIHVPSQNYGIVEDLHQSVMHNLGAIYPIKAHGPSVDSRPKILNGAR